MTVNNPNGSSGGSEQPNGTQDATGSSVSPENPVNTPPRPQTPPSPYVAPQGVGAPEDAQPQPQPGWYSGDVPPAQSQQGPQPQEYVQQPYGYAPQQGYANIPKPRDMTVSYTWAYFLGVFGAHKFYMGQNLQGGIYLALTLASLVLSFLGIGFLLSLLVIFLMYGDLRTMPEQVSRSNNGEQFTDFFEFLKKAFRS